MVKRRREVPNSNENGSQQEWVRGTSALPKVFNQPKGSKLQLTWNVHGKSNGPGNHASLFSESNGVLMAKSRKFDWTKQWDKQDKRQKEWLWGAINDLWELDETREEYTMGVLSSDEFRNKKCKWKKFFYSPYDTLEERVNHKPEQLSQQEWEHLVQFWDTPEQQAISERNKLNRSKQVVKHTSGRTSFPTLREKMMSEESAPPSEGDFFVATHISPKTNGPLNERSREYIDKMKERAGVDEHGTQLPLTDEVYREVMPPERHGRVRLMGRGVTPTRLFGTGTSSRGSSSNHVLELENEKADLKRETQEKEEETQKELDEIKRQAEQSQQELDEVKRQADDLRRQLQTPNEEMEARLMQKLLEMMTPNQRPSRITRRT